MNDEQQPCAHGCPFIGKLAAIVGTASLRPLRPRFCRPYQPYDRQLRESFSKCEGVTAQTTTKTSNPTASPALPLSTASLSREPGTAGMAGDSPEDHRHPQAAWQ